MDAEQKLAGLWAEGQPPIRDPAFAFAVMARIERRRMWGEIFDLAPLVVALGVLAWALAPTAEALLKGGLAELGTTSFLMALSVLLGIWLAMAGSRALRGSPSLS